MKHRFAGFALVLLLAASPLAQAQAPGASTNLDWLLGCWESFERYSKEVWVKNPDGTLLGFSASTDGSDIAFYELLYIKEVGGTLTYTAHPSGQGPATFLVTEIEERRIVFANPQHDYPQLIVYESDGSELTAVISATNGERTLSFTQQRCPKETAGVQ